MEQCKQNPVSSVLLFLCEYPLPVFGVLVSTLGISIAVNIYFCASKHCSEKKNGKGHKERYENPRQMEENPIYGNVTGTYTETSFTSSVRRDQRITQIPQDCYANLSQQRAPMNDGPSAPVIPADLELDLKHDLDPEMDQEDTEVRSALSELYASVQTRAKILQSPDSAEEYANHL